MATYTGTATGGTAGITGNTTTSAAGVYGTSNNGYSPLYGYATGGAAAVYGQTTGSGWGVYGTSSYSTGVGLYGSCTGSGGYGVKGEASGGSGVGVYGTGGAWAGYFVGDVYVSGSVTKSGGGFLIDHPVDPANKICEHSFVESPDRKNVYDGVVTADANGEAVVELPGYFEALNESLRYQLTPIGGAAPDLHVKTEAAGGRFAIAGAKSGQKISWQVTGVRKDPWARANPLVAERDKTPEQRGLFFTPEAHGETADKGVHQVIAPTNGARKPNEP